MTKKTRPTGRAAYEDVARAILHLKTVALVRWNAKRTDIPNPVRGWLEDVREHAEPLEKLRELFEIDLKRRGLL